MLARKDYSRLKMSKLVEDFLNTEERLRNKTISKRFRTWLFSERATHHCQKLERSLSGKKNDPQAGLRLLKEAEEAFKADGFYKKQDNARKKALKKFHEEFEKWLNGKSGLAYREQIEQAGQVEATLQQASDEAERAFARLHPHLMPEGFEDWAKTNIRPHRYGFSEDIDNIIFNVVEPGLKQLGYATAMTIRHWPDIVGPSLARNTRPVRTLYPPKSRTHGKLVLKVRAGFQVEIQHQSAEIIFRINSYLGFACIGELHISKQPFDDVISEGARASRKINASRVRPASAPNQRAQGLIENIDDPELKKAFTELGKVLHSRNG